MDGLTVKNSQAFLQSSKTASELRSSQNAADATGQTQTLAGQPGQVSFADMLKDAVGKVNTMQKTADTKMEQLATGKTDNIQDVMVATEQADIAMRLMVNIRNKVIDAYQEIMKMQV